MLTLLRLHLVPYDEARSPDHSPLGVWRRIPELFRGAEPVPDAHHGQIFKSLPDDGRAGRDHAHVAKLSVSLRVEGMRSRETAKGISYPPHQSTFENRDKPCLQKPLRMPPRSASPFHWAWSISPGTQSAFRIKVRIFAGRSNCCAPSSAVLKRACSKSAAARPIGSLPKARSLGRCCPVSRPLSCSRSVFSPPRGCGVAQRPGLWGEGKEHSWSHNLRHAVRLLLASALPAAVREPPVQRRGPPRALTMSARRRKTCGDWRTPSCSYSLVTQHSTLPTSAAVSSDRPASTYMSSK